MDVQDYIDARTVHEIHTSERKSYRACRRRWDWIFRQSYYPQMTAKPLEFGSAFHVGMEVYYDPKTWGDDREVVAAEAIQAFVDKCNKQKQKALDFQGRPYLDDEVEQDYQERVDLGKGMLSYYFTKVAPVIDKGWKPVKVEISFMVPIPHPKTKQTMWCKCDNCWEKYQKSKFWPAFLERIAECETKRPNTTHDLELEDDRNSHWDGLPVVYAGRLDALVQDDDGNYWIVDWKTARYVTDKTTFMLLDDQIGSYPWALRQCGIRVAGFIYHQQRKGFPQEPTKNKVRRLGCIYSVNKNQDVDYDSYLAAIQENDTEAYETGLYDEMLNFLREEGTVFFRRDVIHKSEDELDEIEYNIGLEALEMIDPAIPIYPSPGRFGCDFCAFQTPCIEKNARSDFQYALDTMFEKREHYYIREDASTESKGGE